MGGGAEKKGAGGREKGKQSRVGEEIGVGKEGAGEG